MTMDFDVRDAKELKGINAGDVVSFRLVVTDDEGWIEQVRRVSTAPGEMPTRENAAAVRTLDPLQPGEVFPDYHFTNELGRAVSLRDFRGKALAVTFIFTRCPFPEFCPKLSKGFAAAYQKLKSERDAPPNWKLLSISFDPEFDTPAVLKSYAQRYSYDSAQWSFLTGSFEEIGGLAAQAGLRFGKEGDSISHNVRTIVIDAQGRLRRVFSDTKWTADDLATELIAAAGTQ